MDHQAIELHPDALLRSDDNDSIDVSESSDHDTDTNENDGMNLNNSAHANYSDADAEVRRGLKGEDRGVFCWRLVVKIIMISMAIILTTLTYVLLSKSEEKDFKAAVRS
jgi:hypothetical protein